MPRELLWEVLSKLAEQQKLVRLLKALHAHIEVKFTVNEVTHLIECIIGVKQGDILGPMRMVMNLNYLIWNMQMIHLSSSNKEEMWR